MDCTRRLSIDLYHSANCCKTHHCQDNLNGGPGVYLFKFDLEPNGRRTDSSQLSLARKQVVTDKQEYRFLTLVVRIKRRVRLNECVVNEIGYSYKQPLVSLKVVNPKPIKDRKSYNYTYQYNISCSFTSSPERLRTQSVSEIMPILDSHIAPRGRSRYGFCLLSVIKLGLSLSVPDYGITVITDNSR
ncbi:hypothetical protein J6590_085126 [Homalodisca vitripennis]|nr:hypothetical protein J6590_085126 [Homalodisca vitripennis]